jgi:hypothetical protein
MPQIQKPIQITVQREITAIGQQLVINSPPEIPERATLHTVFTTVQTPILQA